MFDVLSVQHAVVTCQRMWAQQQPRSLSSHMCQPVVHDKGSLLRVSSCSLHLQMVSFRGMFDLSDVLPPTSSHQFAAAESTLQFSYVLCIQSMVI